MTAIAADLGHILIDRVAAVIAAIFGIARDLAYAHFVFAFSFVGHFFLPPKMILSGDS